MVFKFFSHGLWSEKQSILQHMHKKEFSILTNKCGNKLKHKNEAEYPWLSCLRLFPHSLVKIQNSFCACVEEGCSASLTIAREKQT